MWSKLLKLILIIYFCDYYWVATNFHSKNHRCINHVYKTNQLSIKLSLFLLLSITLVNMSMAKMFFGYSGFNVYYLN